MRQLHKRFFYEKKGGVLGLYLKGNCAEKVRTPFQALAQNHPRRAWRCPPPTEGVKDRTREKKCPICFWWWLAAPCFPWPLALACVQSAAGLEWPGGRRGHAILCIPLLVHLEWHPACLEHTAYSASLEHTAYSVICQWGLKKADVWWLTWL
jgi:hypothetical protein